MAEATLVGEKVLAAAMKKFLINTDKAIDDAVVMTAFKIQNEAIATLTNISPGRTYTRGTITHQASLEGDSPNTDTGNLRNSIQVEHVKGSKVAFVGTDVEYGAILEIEKNRPWLEPSKEKEVEFFGDNVFAAVSNQIKLAGK